MLLRGSGVSKITSPTRARAREKNAPSRFHASKCHLAGANSAARAPKFFSFSAPA